MLCELLNIILRKDCLFAPFTSLDCLILTVMHLIIDQIVRLVVYFAALEIVKDENRVHDLFDCLAAENEGGGTSR